MSNGLYTNEELAGSLIKDLNTLPRLLMNGQFIAFCDLVTQMGKKLSNLKEGIKSDIDNKNKVIEELKRQIKHLGGECTDMTPEEYFKKDGGSNGVD